MDQARGHCGNWRRESEAPRGKPRGIFAEPCEARNAILPCGKPQGFAYSAEAKPLAAKAGLAKKGKILLKLVDERRMLSYYSFFNKEGG